MLFSESTAVITDKTQAKQKHKIAIPTIVPLNSFHVWVRWTFNIQDKAPIVNEIWVMLMENMEKTTKVTKENWVTLSRIGITRFIVGELVLDKNLSIIKK